MDRGATWLGEARTEVWQGGAGLGKVRLGMAWQGEDRGKVRPGLARLGLARPGAAWQGEDRGMAGQGLAWRGKARRGKARLGRATLSGFNDPLFLFTAITTLGGIIDLMPLFFCRILRYVEIRAIQQRR